MLKNKHQIIKQAALVVTIIVLLSLFPRCECNGYNSLFDVPVIEWATRIGGTSADQGYALAVDSEKNIVAAGFVTGNADLNGDGDTDDENEAGTSADIIIVKYTITGKLAWSRRITNSTTSGATGVVIDSSDNILICGYVNGDIDLNNDGDVTDDGEPSTGYGVNDVLLIKLNSVSNTVWAKRLGGTGADIGYGVAVDSSNNVVITGTVTGDADLNGDGSIDVSNPETPSATYGTTADIFISKFTSSGSSSWTKRIGGTGTETGSSVAIDGSNNIVLSGTVDGTADLNGNDSTGDAFETVLSTHGSTDVFISKFDQDGTDIWAQRIGGSFSDSANAVDIDSNDDIVLTAVVFGSADIDASDDITSLPAEDGSINGDDDNDYIIVKFSSTGTVTWAKRLGGTEDEGSIYPFGKNVVINNSDAILVAFEMYGDVDVNGDGDNLDGGAESATGIFDGNDLDIVLSQFSSSGSHLWAVRLGSADDDFAGTVYQDEKYIFLTGYITGTADLNGDGAESGTAETTTQGSSDMFLTVF